MSELAIGVAALPAVTASAIWALRRPDTFALVAVLSAMVLPVAILQPGGAQVGLADVLLIVVAGAWLIASAAGQASPPVIRGNPLFAPTCFWVVANLTSLLWTIDTAASVKSVLQMAEIVVVMPLVFASLPRSADAIRLGLLCIVVASAILAVLAGLSAAPELARGNFSAVDLDYGLNKNAAGSYIGAGFVIAFVLLLGKQESLRAKRWLILLLIVESVGLAATLSRGTMVGVGVAAIGASLVLRRGRLMTIAATLIVLGLFLQLVAPQIQENVGSQAGAYQTDDVRVVSFRNAIEQIKDKPFTGSGSGAYTDYLEEFQFFLPDPNNMFLLTWAELGPLGMVALLFLFWRFGRSWVRLPAVGEAAAVVGVAAGAVSISLLVHFQFDVTWTRGTSSMAFACMGLVIAAARLGERGASA